MSKPVNNLHLQTRNLTDTPSFHVVSVGKNGDVLRESPVPDEDLFRAIDALAERHGVLECEVREAAGSGVAFFLVTARRKSPELSALVKALRGAQ